MKKRLIFIPRFLFPARWLATALLTGIFLGCDPGGDQESVWASVAKSSAMPGTAVPYTLVNYSRGDISIPNCCFRPVVYVQRWNGSGWMESFALGDPCLMLCATRLILVPHGSGYQDSVAIDTVGRYRFRIEYGEGSGSSSGHAVLTNAFDIAYGAD